MKKIDEYKLTILRDALSHCEYLNDSIKEARNQLWILTTITISIIGFLFTQINDHKFLIELKLVYLLSIPFLLFNIYFIILGMMPCEKEDMQPSPSSLEELEVESYYISKINFYKNVSNNYLLILEKIVRAHRMCTYSTLLFLFLNILFFIGRFIAEVSPR